MSRFRSNAPGAGSRARSERFSPARRIAPRMDADRLAAIEQDLLQWGLVERAETLALSRRFRGAVARAAGRLAEEERAGRRPPGPPIENAIALACDDFPLPEGAVLAPDHRKFLVAVELASLPDAVRAAMGL